MQVSTNGNHRCYFGLRRGGCPFFFFLLEAIATIRVLPTRALEYMLIPRRWPRQSCQGVLKLHPDILSLPSATLSPHDSLFVFLEMFKFGVFERVAIHAEQVFRHSSVTTSDFWFNFVEDPGR